MLVKEVYADFPKWWLRDKAWIFDPIISLILGVNQSFVICKCKQFFSHILYDNGVELYTATEI